MKSTFVHMDIQLRTRLGLTILTTTVLLATLLPSSSSSSSSTTIDTGLSPQQKADRLNARLCKCDYIQAFETIECFEIPSDQQQNQKNTSQNRPSPQANASIPRVGGNFSKEEASRKVIITASHLLHSCILNTRQLMIWVDRYNARYVREFTVRNLARIINIGEPRINYPPHSPELWTQSHKQVQKLFLIDTQL